MVQKYKIHKLFSKIVLIIYLNILSYIITIHVGLQFWILYIFLEIYYKAIGVKNCLWAVV